MTEEKTSRFGMPSIRYILIMLLLLAFAGLSTFAVMSDTSIHGLTVRFYGNVNRYCNMTGTTPILAFNFYTITVYSSTSLTTSLSHVTFSMSLNGIQIETVNAGNAKFDPGHSFTYYATFSNSTLDPHSQALVSQIALTVNAQASAGLYSAKVATSDSETVHFSGQAC